MKKLALRHLATNDIVTGKRYWDQEMRNQVHKLTYDSMRIQWEYGELDPHGNFISIEKQ